MTLKEQWEAGKTGVCAIPRTDRGLIEISGQDRGAFLQGLFSRDVAKNFSVGSVAYGVFPNVKGKVFADAMVAHVDENRFVLDVEASIADELLAYLDKYLILMKAEIKRLNGYSRFSFVGPKTDSILEKCLPLENGFSFSFERRSLHELAIWGKDAAAANFLATMEKQGAIVAEESLYEVQRIESGIPKLGVDMDETTFPQEVGLEEYLDFKKGCFVGAEVLQRIFYQGHVNRALALFSASESLLPDSSIFQENAEVGKITSCVLSFQWNQSIALGLVKSAALESNAPLSARVKDKTSRLEVLKVFQPAKK